MSIVQRVLCVGNELCHDDGVAAHVGHWIEERGRTLPDVEVLYCPEFGLSCLDVFLDVRRVVVVDAVVSEREPGDCGVVCLETLRSSASCSVGHAVTLPSLLELVANLAPTGRAPEVVLVGIEAENMSPFGTHLSPRVQAAIPRAGELVLSLLACPEQVTTTTRPH